MTLEELRRALRRAKTPFMTLEQVLATGVTVVLPGNLGKTVVRELEDGTAFSAVTLLTDAFRSQILAENLDIGRANMRTIAIVTAQSIVEHMTMEKRRYGSRLFTVPFAAPRDLLEMNVFYGLKNAIAELSGAKVVEHASGFHKMAGGIRALTISFE